MKGEFRLQNIQMFSRQHQTLMRYFNRKNSINKLSVRKAYQEKNNDLGFINVLK